MVSSSFARFLESIQSGFFLCLHQFLQRKFLFRSQNGSAVIYVCCRAYFCNQAYIICIELLLPYGIGIGFGGNAYLNLSLTFIALLGFNLIFATFRVDEIAVFLLKYVKELEKVIIGLVF